MRKTISFFVNDQLRELQNVDPNLTVLQYLRREERACGTKEGCAEGDCGACTVVLAELSQEGLQYKAINSCITFVPQLHGKQLLTVEALEAPDGRLHPVQNAMVKCHGSQCGFCTPGFVMSLFAHYKEHPRFAQESVEDALVGNLCRCTGYRPIVEAAKQMYTEQGSGQLDERHELRIIDRLKDLQPGGFCVGNGTRTWYAPDTLEEFLRLRLEMPEATIIAGGTDLGLLVTKQHREIKTILSLQCVRELKTLDSSGDEVRIGAGVPYHEALPVLQEEFPAFARLILRLGSVQIRNLGTIGGNLVNASPIGDSAPCLIALEAKLVLASQSGSREVKAADFFSGYRKTCLSQDEVLVEIHIPKLKGRRFEAFKVSQRFDQDISSVCMAISLQLSGDRVQFVRIGCGGVAATPVQASQTESYLQGVEWNEKVISLAAQVLKEEFQPLSDFRSSETYRRQALRNLLLRFFHMTQNTEQVLEVRNYA